MIEYIILLFIVLFIVPIGSDVGGNPITLFQEIMTEIF